MTITKTKWEQCPDPTGIYLEMLGFYTFELYIKKSILGYYLIRFNHKSQNSVETKINGYTSTLSKIKEFANSYLKSQNIINY